MGTNGAPTLKTTPSTWWKSSPSAPPSGTTMPISSSGFASRPSSRNASSNRSRSGMRAASTRIVLDMSSPSLGFGSEIYRTGRRDKRGRFRPMAVSASGRTIVFFPEGAFGPTNNCVGIGDVLRRRGHRVVFIVEESFAGTLEQKGFEERLMRLGPPPEQAEEPGQFWKEFIRETAPVFHRPTIEQLEGFIRPTWEALVDGARYVEPRLREILDEVRPDAIVED